MCIWNVNEAERHCDLCAYGGGCETREFHETKTVEDVGRKYVAVLCGIMGMDVRDKTRKHEIVWARNMAFYQLTEDGFSLIKVGKFMGFNHSTVLYGRRQVEQMLKRPSMYKEETAIWQKFQRSIAI